ncbi:MAG: transglutaminase domain-containing protein [Ginsengibacter sp.]
MKSVLILVCVACVTLAGNSQDADAYREADRISLHIPIAQTNTTADIASFIKAHFDTDEKKVWAIYTWVTANIRYDADSIHRVILDEDNYELVSYALRRRKGVCENFAAIFNDICRKSGLLSFMVDGYTSQNGSVDRSTHAWCTVCIDNKWLLYDPTWDAGFAGGYTTPRAHYFQASPGIFIHSHIPFDPMFQLLNYPITYKEFNSGNLGMNSSKPYFNYTDSLNAYEKLNPLNKYIAALSRIQSNGAPNEKVKTKISKLKMEIEIIYQDKDSVLYNSAIADYNYAINNFNNFVTYRNNQFKPAKTNAEIKAIFDGIEKRINSATGKLKELNQSKATLTLDSGDVEYALANLSTRVKEQKEFIKNYQGTAKQN